MRLKLTIVSPTSPDHLRIIYPLPPAFLSSSPTILDLVYTIHEIFPSFFHDIHELESYKDRQQNPDDHKYAEELFRPPEYACETADGWKFCLWHLVADSLRDEDHIVIRKLEEENMLACPRVSSPEKLTYPGPVADVLRLMNGNKASVTAGQKRTRDEDDREDELPTAASGESGAKRLKVEPDSNSALPLSATTTTEDAAILKSPPFQGSGATKSRNARRRRAKAERKRLEQETLEKARSELLARAEKLVVVADESTTKQKELDAVNEKDKTTDSEDVDKVGESSRTPRLSIMDKIGSQIQSALSTLSQVVKVATPQPKKGDSRLQSAMVEDEAEDDLKDEVQVAVDTVEQDDEAAHDSASQDKAFAPATVTKRRKPVVVIAEAVDCENPANRELEIPPFPFQQVNLDEYWNPKYGQRC
ncbi:hypothetical protein V1520DRAFT_328487 [Lipomyces starkeyi]|uniref:Uncharacterized protein n=1 Tax=Lipomyces starkeyi NRRL Y-11557 TaxID=675824 RepID=A0A1E3QGM6_LIPST|nr:hypothetical protein LIPSTDRAFT_25111 [Lipomyces starkeyi NRRL Y-11557]